MRSAQKLQEKKIHTTVPTGAISERSSPTDFVVETLGGAEDELPASVRAE